MNTYIVYLLFFILGTLFGALVLGFRLKNKSVSLNAYKRELEKESISSDESASRLKVLEAKIVVLEKALDKALKKS